MNYLIRDLNQDEKPREKLKKLGAANLTDAELIALILRSGGKKTSAIDLAKEVLNTVSGIKALKKCDVQQLLQIKNIEIAKASSIVAAVELGSRVSLNSYTEIPTITKPEHIVTLLQQELFEKDKEYLYLISLNSRNKLLAKDLLSVGTVNETLLSPREVFRQALFRNATSIILVHNHPSNDPAPSTEDIDITKKIYKLSMELGLVLLDHVIICNESFFSMKAENLISGI